MSYMENKEKVKLSIFICGEIGINHNGNMDICKKLIDIAVESNCDAVKFQKRDIDLVYSKEVLDSPRESPWGKTQREQKLGLEFGLEEYKEIDNYCKTKGIEWYASAWDLNSQEFLRQFNCKYNKVASAMLVYEDLLREVAKDKKHTFISTGMSTYEDIDNAVEIFKSMNCPFELMHTVSTYPMKDEHANLKMIQVLKQRYGVDVGYSGHETGLAISCAAAALVPTDATHSPTPGARPRSGPRPPQRALSRPCRPSPRPSPQPSPMGARLREWL